MTKRLTPQNATITTATVEVKTLTISGKQVTLAVFRQLIEENPIGADGTLNGTVWGTVNYHPDKCSNAVPHWHLVWQKDTELRRARIDQKPSFGYFGSETGDQFISAHVREVLDGRGRYMQGQIPNTDSYGNVRLRLPSGITLEMTVNSSLMAAARSWTSWQNQLKAIQESPNPDHRTGTNYYKEAAESAINRLDPALEPAMVDELKRILDAEIEAEVQRRTRHAQALKAIAELPQLFIAV
ncbi:hypothetical protein ABT255_47495 [Streptomyces mirabilis]|uniref:hypothetical protein n=1 Tax=Streptomyces mirabilis TaxID=68239 RepID=UPI0033299EFE